MLNTRRIEPGARRHRLNVVYAALRNAAGLAPCHQTTCLRACCMTAEQTDLTSGRAPGMQEPSTHSSCHDALFDASYTRRNRCTTGYSTARGYYTTRTLKAVLKRDFLRLSADAFAIFATCGVIRNVMNESVCGFVKLRGRILSDSRRYRARERIVLASCGAANSGEVAAAFGGIDARFVVFVRLLTFACGIAFRRRQCGRAGGGIGGVMRRERGGFRGRHACGSLSGGIVVGAVGRDGHIVRRERGDGRGDIDGSERLVRHAGGGEDGIVFSRRAFAARRGRSERGRRGLPQVLACARNALQRFVQRVGFAWRA